MRQLEAEGLVSILPNKGATVSTLSLDDVLELMEIRIALECRALQLDIPNMVDADLDAAVLRAKYPDRKRYAIVPGKIGLQSYAGQKRAGYVHGPSIADVNVPIQFHDATRAPAFEASVAFGRRLEPWLAAAAATSRR